MRFFMTLFIITTVLMTWSQVSADELDLMLDGFDDEPPAVVVAPHEMKKKQITIYGALNLSAMARTGGGETLAELSAELDLKAKATTKGGWKGYMRVEGSHDVAPAINNASHSPYRDDVEKKVELHELWVEKSLTPWLDMKLGRQIVSWGTSESFRVVDVVNPVNRQEFGMTDIEDIRLGQTMSRFDLYSGPWNLSAILIHGEQHTETPQPGSDYNVGPLNRPSLSEENRDILPDRFAAALTGRFSGWDAGLYAARVEDDLFYLTRDSNNIAIRRYPDITMVGATLTKALGNVLLKAETAHLSGLRFSSLPENDVSQTETLIGTEYSGFSETTLTVEVVHHHIHDFNDTLTSDGHKENLMEYAVRFSRTFLNETLEATLIAGFSGEKGDLGSFQRLEMEYDASDSLALQMGSVIYHGGDSAMYQKIADNDRVFATVSLFF